MLVGIIQTRDVVRNSREILKLYGMRVWCRCLLCAASPKVHTFLEIISR
jgi:hypothetical protein